MPDASVDRGRVQYIFPPPEDRETSMLSWAIGLHAGSWAQNLPVMGDLRQLFTNQQSWHSGFQHRTNFGCKLLNGERLADQLDTRIHDAIVDDCVAGVARGEQHF